MLGAYLPILLLVIVAIGFGLGVTGGFIPDRTEEVFGVKTVSLRVRLRAGRDRPGAFLDQVLPDRHAVHPVRYRVVFLYPWAVLYKKLGLFGLVEMGLFIVILFVGYIYVWKKGALEWE